MTPEHRLFLAATTTAPSEERVEEVRLIVERGVDWSIVAGRARRHGTIPLLQSLLERAAWDRVPEDVRSSLQNFVRAVAMRNLHLGNEMRRLQADFKTASIPSIFFKGPILALDAYGGLGFRQSGDVDVLVPRTHFAKAEALLRDGGFIPYYKIQRLGRIRRALHLRLARQIPYRQPNRADIDLHSGVVGLGHHFSLPFAALDARAREFEIGPGQVRTFSPEDMLLVLCYQGVNNRWLALKHVSDVTALITAHDSLNWENVMDSATRMNGRRVVLHGAHLAREVGGCELPPVIEKEFAEDRTLQRLSADVVARMRAEETRDLTFRERMSYYPAVHRSVVDKGRYMIFSMARRVVSPAV